MGKTAIEWTEYTWNPLRGCSRVSEGCRNCYAEKVAARFSGPGQPYEGTINRHGAWNGTVRLVDAALDQPLRWKRPRRIFVNSMSDLFHEDVPDEFIDQVFAVMAMAKRHNFQVLTKRPERMLAYFAPGKNIMARWGFWGSAILGNAHEAMMREPRWPLPNVWLGVSVEDQATADERIPLLLKTPAAVRWISAEPLLGPVDVRRWMPGACQHPRCDNGSVPVEGGGAPCPWCQCGPRVGLDWVVVGGESGRGARPMLPTWARALRDQCVAAGVPFLFKQWGEWTPTPDGPDSFEAHRARGARDLFVFKEDGAAVELVGKKRAGRELDGRTWDEYPR